MRIRFENRDAVVGLMMPMRKPKNELCTYCLIEIVDEEPIVEQEPDGEMLIFHPLCQEWRHRRLTDVTLPLFPPRPVPVKRVMTDVLAAPAPVPVSPVELPIKRGRGRPRKNPLPIVPVVVGPAPVKRGRGRPRKIR